MKRLIMKRLIKSLALVGVLTVVWAAPTLSVQAAGKLFLFAGQSNMVGMGDRTTLTAAERASVTNVLVFVADPGHPPPQALFLHPVLGAAAGRAQQLRDVGSIRAARGTRCNPGHYNCPNNFGPEFTTVRDLASAMGEQIYFAKYCPRRHGS